MAEQERSAVQQREKARGALRALYLGELTAIGQRRAQALRAAEEELELLGRLLTNAIDAGIGLSEIARVAGVSRPTLYELRARHSDRPGDLRLAVLQSTADGGVTVRELAESLNKPVSDVEPVLVELKERGWVHEEPIEYVDGGRGWLWTLGLAGLKALEHWTFTDARSDEERPG
jgi:DNA-binding phage protein